MPFNRYLNKVIRTEHLQADSVGNAQTDANQPKHLTFLYDFAALGGATGSLTLTAEDGSAQTIPDNAIITNAYAEVETAVTSGGSATVALGIIANTDAFVGATAKASLGLNVVLNTVNDLPLKPGVAAPVLATIATAALTAGKIRVYVEYIEGTA